MQTSNKRSSSCVFNLNIVEITINIKKQLQFLFVVKACALEWQISKYYMHIQCTEGRYHIYM